VIAVVDLANASYGLMLRLLAYAYALPGPSAEKSLSADLAIGLMQAMVPLAERAARLPAGPSNPHCHAECRLLLCATPQRCRRGAAPGDSSSNVLRSWRMPVPRYVRAVIRARWLPPICWRSCRSGQPGV